ncbi:MAG: hypothetical protein H6882_09715 [Rhodobiaceae bacterium]|nr:hypothetical protein [Rhodobiaceae bacterium]
MPNLKTARANAGDGQPKELSVGFLLLSNFTTPFATFIDARVLLPTRLTCRA